MKKTTQNRVKPTRSLCWPASFRQQTVKAIAKKGICSKTQNKLVPESKTTENPPLVFF